MRLHFLLLRSLLRNLFRLLSPLPFLLLQASSFAQIQQPVLGIMHDGNAALRPVYGIAASATLGGVAVENVDAFSCAHSQCFVQTLGSLWMYDSSGSRSILDSISGPVPMALTNDGVLLYSSQTGELLRWNPINGWASSTLPTTSDHTILAFKPAGDGIDAAVRRDDGLWMEHLAADASITTFSAIPEDAENPVRAICLLDDGYLIATGHAVSLVRSDGSAQEFAIGGVRSFSAMSDSAVEAESSQGNWIFEQDAGKIRVSLLPGVEPAQTAPAGEVAE
ncbi:MAG: hypothetical protein ABL967_04830 [Bryobacteraceae bacterium]